MHGGGPAFRPVVFGTPSSSLSAEQHPVVAGEPVGALAKSDSITSTVFTSTDAASAAVLGRRGGSSAGDTTVTITTTTTTAAAAAPSTVSRRVRSNPFDEQVHATAANSAARLHATAAAATGRTAMRGPALGKRASQMDVEVFFRDMQRSTGASSPPLSLLMPEALLPSTITTTATWPPPSASTSSSSLSRSTDNTAADWILASTASSANTSAFSGLDTADLNAVEWAALHGGVKVTRDDPSDDEQEPEGKKANAPTNVSSSSSHGRPTLKRVLSQSPPSACLAPLGEDGEDGEDSFARDLLLRPADDDAAIFPLLQLQLMSNAAVGGAASSGRRAADEQQQQQEQIPQPPPPQKQTLADVFGSPPYTPRPRTSSNMPSAQSAQSAQSRRQQAAGRAAVAAGFSFSSPPPPALRTPPSSESKAAKRQLSSSSSTNSNNTSSTLVLSPVKRRHSEPLVGARKTPRRQSSFAGASSSPLHAHTHTFSPTHVVEVEVDEERWGDEEDGEDMLDDEEEFLDADDTCRISMHSFLSQAREQLQKQQQQQQDEAASGYLHHHLARRASLHVVSRASRLDAQQTPLLLAYSFQ